MDQQTLLRALGAASLAAALTLGAGCGETPEVKLQRAKIALSNAKPAQALTLADELLEKKPGDAETMRIKAQAQMQLGRLDESKRTLDELLKAQPDSAELHLLVSGWAFVRLKNLHDQSSFVTDPKMQAKFDEALTIGGREADWLEAHGARGDARHLKARYAEADAKRLESIAATERKNLRNANLDDNRDPEDSETVRDLVARSRAKLREAEEQLRAALDADPRQFGAAATYVRLLSERQAWEELWPVVEVLSKEKDLPPALYENATAAMLRMPDSVRPLAARLEIGRALGAGVSKAGKDTPAWKAATARLHLAAGAPAEALPLAEAVVKAKPRDPDARFLLGQCLYRLEKYAQAKDLVIQLAADSPRDPRIQALAASVLDKTGDTAMAMEAARRVVDLAPGDPAATDIMLRLLAAKNQLPAAANDIEQMYREHPNDARAVRYKLQLEIISGRRDGVAAVVERLAKVDPLTDDHLMWLADGYSHLRRHDRLEATLQELVRRQPDSLDYQLRLAEAWLAQGKEEQVKSKLAELKGRFPEAANIDLALGRLYLQAQLFDRALAVLDGVVRADPGNAQARLMLARALGSLARTDEAIEQVEKVLEFRPGDLQAHALAARIYQLTGDAAKAGEHLAQIDESQIDERRDPALLAQLLLRRNDLDRAAEVCNSAVSQGHTDPALRYMLAAIYVTKKDHAQAELNLMALARSQPNNPQVYSLLTRYYTDQKLIDRGVGQVQTLEPLNQPLSRLAQAALLHAGGKPDEGVARLGPMCEPLVAQRHPLALPVADALSRLHLARNDRKAASAVYEPLKAAGFLAGEATLRQITLAGEADGQEETVRKLDALAAKLNPEQHRLRYELIQRYADLRRPDRALSLVDAWLKANPENADLTRMKGELLVKTGEAGEAIGVFREAVRLAPDNYQARVRLAQAHVANWDYPAAEAAFEEMTRLDKGGQVLGLASAGQMYLALGLKHQATETFDRLEAVGAPADPRVMLATGQAYAALRQDDRAMKRLAQVPAHAIQYGPAQVLMARLDHRAGRLGEAKGRLEALMREPRTAGTAAADLLALNFRSASDEEMLKWSDQALSVEKLPAAVRVPWLRLRVAVAAKQKNWDGAVRALDDLAALEPDSSQTAAARVALLLRLRKRDEAAGVYRRSPALAASQVGPLAAILVGEKASPAPDSPVSVFVAAMARGDVPAARSAAERVPAMRTVYASDLVKMTERSDAAAPQMGDACAMLGETLLALHGDLPQLALDRTEDLVERYKGLVLAHALLVQATLDMGNPLAKPLERIRAETGGSALAAFVGALQKKADKDFAGAANDLRGLLKAQPDNEHVKYELAQALQRAGKVEESLPLLRELLAGRNAYTVAAGNDLAYLLATHHPDQLAEAEKIATKAFESAPQLAALRDTVGWIAHLRGDDVAALGHLNRAVTKLSDSPEVHAHLAKVYGKLGNARWAGYHQKEAAAKAG